MTTTFEAVCMILNEIYSTIRTKHNLTDFITSYAEGKYGEGS